MPTKAKSPRQRRAAVFFSLPAEGNGDIPLHERLYRRLRQLILSGALGNGARLAPSRALAANLGVSRNSVLAAIDQLIADGWLQSRGHSGVYVSYEGLRTGHVQMQPGEKIAAVPFELGWPADIFPVSQWLRLQARNWHKSADLGLRQGDRLGLPQLREAIAAYVAVTRGLHCSPVQVVITSSIPSAIDLSVRALELTGHEALTEDPNCPADFAALLRSGVRPVPVPVDDEGMDVDAGTRTSPLARMALITPTCQAPTGTTMSQDRKSALSRWAVESGAWILENDFNWNGDGIFRSVRPLAEFEPARTLYLNSFNNVLFPGLRIAYVVIPPDLIDRFAAVRGTEGEVNTLNQLALTDFLVAGHCERHLRRLNACNAERRAALAMSIERDLGDIVVPYRTPGGYFIGAVDGAPERTLISTCAASGIVLTAMSHYRIAPSNRTEVIFGFSQFRPYALSAATQKLRELLESPKN